MADKPRRPKVGMPVVVTDDCGDQMPGLIQAIVEPDEGRPDMERIRVVAFGDDELFCYTLDHSEDWPFRMTWRFVEED